MNAPKQKASRPKSLETGNSEALLAIPCSCSRALGTHPFELLLVWLTLASLEARKKRACALASERRRRREIARYRRFLRDEESLACQPEMLLLRGFTRLRAQWNPQTHQLLADGAGIGRADIRLAARLLLSGSLWGPERIQSLWKDWSGVLPEEDRVVGEAVHTVLVDVLEHLAAETPRNPVSSPATKGPQFGYSSHEPARLLPPVRLTARRTLRRQTDQQLTVAGIDPGHRR